MTDKVQKIREEVEKLKSNLMYGACSSQVAMETRCKEESYNEVLAILDSMQEEPVSEDLDLGCGVIWKNEEPVSKFVYPDKLYARTNDNITIDISYAPQTLEAVEYTRTDAFIEKALKWYCLDCECNDNCKDIKCFFHNAYKRYLEGETNSLPPKFSDTILNEDGGISDNWGYRHFTSKMQDAFIEKADEFIGSFFHPDDTDLRNCLLKKFHEYMKGE